MSRRAKRMERHHKKKGGGLNLVSLMDIFTILVFFLLVNSSNAPQLPSAKELKLPESTTQKAPEETLVITISKADILVQGRKVASIRKVLKSEDDVIADLKKELDFQAGSEAKKQEAKKITIIGDQTVSYDLVRKILSTCAQANYTNVAFAATQIAK